MPVRAAPHTRKIRPTTLIFWAIGMLLMVAWGAPFIWMISTSLKPTADVMTRHVQWFPHHVTLANYAQVFQKPVLRWLLNSGIVATVSTIGSLFFGAMAGYAFARLNFPGRKVLFFACLAAYMIPSEMTIVPLFIGFLRIHLVNNYAALILPSLANVFSVYLFRQFFLSLPRELEDAAEIDGAGKFRIFWSIALPLARPAVIAGGILIFTTNWNAFLWPLLVLFEEGKKTLPVGMAAFSPSVGQQTQIQSFGPAMAAVTILALPSLIVFFALQRYFVEGVSNVGIKG